MRNIKLTIEYDGTNYAGWQKQKYIATIQEKIEEVIEVLTGEFSEVIGSSRTDSGVHARGYVCNFITKSKIPVENIKRALNTFLPKDIVIIKSEEMDLKFHSRYYSTGKRYIYTVLTGENRPAIGRNYVYYFNRKLDIEKMKEAATYVLGTHDFSAFRNLGSSTTSTTRTIHRLDIIEDEKLIKFDIVGDGFLYNMVRIIVGTLLDVGVGRFEPTYIIEVINSKDRSKAGKSAPASGLCLEEVFY